MWFKGLGSGRGAVYPGLRVDAQRVSSAAAGEERIPPAGARSPSVGPVVLPGGTTPRNPPGRGRRPGRNPKVAGCRSRLARLLPRAERQARGLAGVRVRACKKAKLSLPAGKERAVT